MNWMHELENYSDNDYYYVSTTIGMDTETHALWAIVYAVRNVGEIRIDLCRQDGRDWTYVLNYDSDDVMTSAAFHDKQRDDPEMKGEYFDEFIEELSYRVIELMKTDLDRADIPRFIAAFKLEN